MKPAIGEEPAITRAIRKIEKDEGTTFREFRNGIVIRGRWAETWYGLHRVSWDMIRMRPKGKQGTLPVKP